MTPPPIVSIVTPTRNQGSFIRETIDSVLSQTYPHLEYWVIDGSSTDNTVDILRSIQDDRFHWISEPDRGQSDAIMKGFRRVTGSFLGWVNSDDILASQALEWIVQEFTTSEDIGLVYGDLMVVDTLRQPIIRLHPGELSYKRLLTQSQSITQLGSFYRRNYLEMAGNIDLNLHFVMDYDLFIRLLKISQSRYIPQILGEFRLHAESKSYNFNDTRFLYEAFRVSRRYGAPIFTALNWRRLNSFMKGNIKRALGMPGIDINRLRKRAEILNVSAYEPK
jgi:glycosyltransferase involved in cell wall biosynthesis